MESYVISKSIAFTVEQVDVLYLAKQIYLDLRSLNKAYPKIIPSEYVYSLFDACSDFLANYAVKRIGFSIIDPKDNDLVYHELRYKVLYGGEVTVINPNKGRRGRGGIAIDAVWVPKTATFTAWVVWSSHMLNLSRIKQKNIVSGTDWSIPGEGSKFRGNYQGGNWSSIGSYASGNIGATGSLWKKN